MRITHALYLTAALLASGSATTGAQTRPATADFIVVNARTYTADDTRPIVSAFAVRNDRILFAGSEGEVRALAGPSTRVLDLAGRTVIPGMVDAHAHLVGLGQSLRNVALAGSASYEDVIARVAARVRTAPRGEWILGRGWDQNLWADKEFPTHEALSRAFPDHPVVLTRVDGHALLANRRAMEAAGVTAATVDPDGGRIIRLRDNSPSGVFIDNAQGLVRRAVPGLTREQTREAILAAVAEANRWGLTGIHDAGAGRSAITLYEELARAGQYNLRNYVMISDDSADIAHYVARGPQNALHGGRIWIRSIKLYSDGALGSRGAALLEPYSDDPGNRGLLVSDPAHIQRAAVLGLRSGFQIAVHAIGDRGNRIVLDAFEAALKVVPRADHRFRVEHAQVIALDDIPRFAQLGVIPSMQGSHQTSDMPWAEARVGPQRIKGAYAWRSLLDHGSIIPNGSDFPVEMVNPLISFHSAATRQSPDNQPPGGWYPEQAMTRDEALKAMTIWPAYAAFQEKDAGSISPGKYADFVVLDRDIMKVPVQEILAARVVATYLGGKAVYQLESR